MPRTRNIADIKEDSVFILQAGTPVFVKTADICAMTGKSNQWIGQLTSQGILKKKQTAHGAMYDLIETVKSYCEMLESRVDEHDEKEAEVELAKLKAEMIYKKSKATIANLDAQERLGKMHRSEDVQAMTEDLIYAIRSALVALPGRLAVAVVNAGDSAEAAEIIRKEVYEVMDELSNYKYDSEKYQERVRQRLRLESADLNSNEEE